MRIEDATIISMNSVVSKDVPPNSIAAGNPSRLIQKSYDFELILILKNKDGFN